VSAQKRGLLLALPRGSMLFMLQFLQQPGYAHNIESTQILHLNNTEPEPVMATDELLVTCAEQHSSAFTADGLAYERNCSCAPQQTATALN
jgi:hypothetical protein